MKKISVVVNKNWETEPVLCAMTSSEIIPSQLPFPDPLRSPRPAKNKMKDPRAVFSFKNGDDISMITNVWCIQDLMSTAASSSSSEEKFKVLPSVLAADNPDLVIAVGTAGYPSDDSWNGSISIGANFFLHDGHPGNPDSNLQHADIGKLIPSNVNKELFKIFNPAFKSQTEPKFIPTPRNPARDPVCLASRVYSAVSSVNVTDYTEYNWVDHEAIAHYGQVEKRFPIVSLETTHGVIRLSTDKPIIFVSAITDRLGRFESEVTASQNFTAAFNAGIVLAQMLVSLNGLPADFRFGL